MILSCPLYPQTAICEWSVIVFERGITYASRRVCSMILYCLVFAMKQCMNSACFATKINQHCWLLNKVWFLKSWYFVLIAITLHLNVSGRSSRWWLHKFWWPFQIQCVTQILISSSEGQKMLLHDRITSFVWFLVLKHCIKSLFLATIVWKWSISIPYASHHISQSLFRSLITE